MKKILKTLITSSLLMLGSCNEAITFVNENGMVIEANVNESEVEYVNLGCTYTEDDLVRWNTGEIIKKDDCAELTLCVAVPSGGIRNKLIRLDRESLEGKVINAYIYQYKLDSNGIGAASYYRWDIKINVDLEFVENVDSIELINVYDQSTYGK